MSDKWDENSYWKGVVSRERVTRQLHKQKNLSNIEGDLRHGASEQPWRIICHFKGYHSTQVDMYKQGEEQLVTVDYSDTAFDQADKYFAMLGLVIYLVNSASQNKRPKEQIPSP